MRRTDESLELMMKTILLLAFICIFTTAAEKSTFTTNDHVKVEMLSPSKLAIAKPGAVTFHFIPIDGIHINAEPMFELKLDKDSQFEVTGEPRYTKNEKEYIDIKKPIEFSIKTKSGTKPGTYQLKAKLYYFYCSDKEGWCNRFSQPIECSATVTR